MLSLSETVSEIYQGGLHNHNDLMSKNLEIVFVIFDAPLVKPWC